VIFDRLENPAALQMLWWLPAVAFGAWFFTKRARLRLARHISAKLVPLLTSSVSPARRRWKTVLQLVVLALFAVALARPQSGESKQKVKSEGVEIMVLFDVSSSMLAEDVRPSRLELAKKEVSRFIDLAGGDKMGLIAFAGSAVTLSPLTTDKQALKMFIDSLSPSTVSTQGTDFRRALSEAKSAFARGGVDPGDDGVVTRVILVVSDGEDNEQGAKDIARELSSGGVRLFTMAVGTVAGGTIPLRDDRGQTIGNLRDKSGNEVVSKVGGEALRELAEMGKGQFYHLTFGGEAVQAAIGDLGRLQKALFDDAEITSYDEIYQPFLLAAIVLALLEMILGERARPGRSWRGRFEVAKS
jgi:Ca-activated chloride channel homolog